ncbi:hypothetical protein KC921_02415 [Candidatus Woesebacteria bacterium]|nr:hypothetical protein [Candidatus Woesebacteria bacterium]
MIFRKEVETMRRGTRFSRRDLGSLFGFSDSAEEEIAFEWFLDTVLGDPQSVKYLRTSLQDTIRLSIEVQFAAGLPRGFVFLPGVYWPVQPTEDSEIQRVLSTDQLAVLCGLPLPVTSNDYARLAGSCLDLKERPASLNGVVKNVIASLQSLRAY